MIPNCYDPVYQEETRQMSWDRAMGNAPRCGCCDDRIVPGDYYHEHLRLILCHKCFNRLADSEAIMEVS